MPEKYWIQDGGHGGNDPGAIANGIVEKEYTLEASRYVDRRLGELRINSHMTRHKDENYPEDERVGKVSGYQKAISHHYNAGGGDGAEFIHSIYASGSFEKLLKEEFKNAGYPTRRIFDRKYPGDKKSDYYYMHRRTGKCRTTIVEYDFIDGPNADKLKDKGYREGMYECVIKAICRDEGVDYKPVVTPKNENRSDLLYRVVTGSFANRDNAEHRIDDLKKAGFDSFIDVYQK